MNPLDFLFPKKCVGCKRVGTYFCPECIKEIKQTDLVCPKCERLSLGGVIHPICKRKYGLDGLWSLGVYQTPLKTGIQKLKYKWITELAEVLINITLEYWARYQPNLLDQIKKDRGDNWLVVPVPLHPVRQNWRGFNQSALLGKVLAQKMGLKYAEILKKVKHTKPQMQLKASERRKNIKGAFEIDPSVATLLQDDNLRAKNYTQTVNSLVNAKVLLIDDVWTTGSTLKECGFILKRAGAKTVWALTLAR